MIKSNSVGDFRKSLEQISAVDALVATNGGKYVQHDNREIQVYFSLFLFLRAGCGEVEGIRGLSSRGSGSKARPSTVGSWEMRLWAEPAFETSIKLFLSVLKNGVGNKES